MGGQKVKKLAEIFMVVAGILYVLVIKKFRFLFLFFKFMCHFKSNTWNISMDDFQA
jgi:hypothetical protein